MKNLTINFLFFIVISILCFPSPSFSQAKDVLKIGDISNYSGEVMIRTKGRWSRLKTVPFPVFSSDKVVTKKGRAEITLVDGGILRMEVDSNISIYQQREAGSGMTSSRQVNVLVGKIWFNIQVDKEGSEKADTSAKAKLSKAFQRLMKPGPKITFRTPSMVTAVRGTSGLFKVEADGSSKYGLATGKADAAGNFAPIDKPIAIQSSDVSKPESQIPASDPAINALPFQKGALDAVITNETADTQFQQAAIITERSNQEMPMERAEASVLQANAYSSMTSAGVKAAEVAVADADRLEPINGLTYQERTPWSTAANWLAVTLPLFAPEAIAADPAAAPPESAYEKILAAAREAAEKARLATRNARELSAKVTIAPTLEAANAAAEGTKAAAAMARTNAKVADAHASWAVASGGDTWWELGKKGMKPEASIKASKAAISAAIFANRAEEAVNLASSLVTVATSSTSKAAAQAAAFASQAAASTAEANAAAAGAVAHEAAAAAASESAAAATARKIATLAQTNVEKATKATENSANQVAVAQKAKTETGALAAVSAAQAGASAARANATAAGAIESVAGLATTGDTQITSDAKSRSDKIGKSAEQADKAAATSAAQAKIAAEASTDAEAKTAADEAAKAAQQAINAAQDAEAENFELSKIGGLQMPGKVIIIKGKKPADFNHENHRKAGLACIDCHHDANHQPLTENNISKIRDKEELRCTTCHNEKFTNKALQQKQTVYHSLCLDCHKSFIDVKKGPTQCGECHALDNEAEEEVSPLEEKYDPEDSNVCLACHNHREKYDNGIELNSIHRPFMEMQCKRCHIPGEEKDEAKKEDYNQKTDDKETKTRWLGKDYIPAKIHWFSAPADRVGKNLIVIGGNTGIEETFRTNFAVPGIAQLEKLTNDKTPPIISRIKVLEVLHGVIISAVIGWETDEFSDTRITYGIDKLQMTTDLDVQMVKEHRMTLANLKPNQTYQFSVVSSDLFGNAQRSEDFTFTTAKPFEAEEAKKEQEKEAGQKSTLRLNKDFFKSEDEKNYLIRLTVNRPITMFVATQLVKTQKERKTVKWGMAERRQVKNDIPMAHWVVRDVYESSVDLCASCHADYVEKTLHPLKVLPPKGMHLPEDFPVLPDGRISCVSCHDPHATDYQWLLRRDAKRDVCGGCHGDKVDELPIFSH